MKTKSDKGWTPIHNGEIYCSPRCGGGCTFAKFVQAKTESAAIAKRLGKGWKTRVHENLGWHYSVISPTGTLRVSGPYGTLRASDGFSASLNKRGDIGIRFSGHGPTPEKAIAATLKAARKEAAFISKLLKGL